MNERNKLSLSLFAKIAALVVWLVLTIITCAGNWNYNTEGFVKVCTFILFAINIAAIGYLFVKWRKEYNAAIEEIQKKERQELIDNANQQKKK